MELGEALLRLLTGIAGGRGCVLVLEDLHWADPDTVAVLEYLGDNIATAGVLCVVTLRTDTNGDALRTIRALASRRSASVLEPRRLRADELIEMTQRCLAVDALPEDVDAVVQRFSDGLPFLVEELLASAIANGALVDGPDGWQVTAGARPAVPQGFEDLVRRRVANLTEDDASTLSMAAVLGPRFDAGLLLTITGQSTDHILGTLRKGVTAQLLIADATDPRAFAFRHALTRDALLAQLLPFERVEAAWRVLAAIEAHHPDLPGGLCELAAMLAEQVGDREHAAELLLQAARRACACGALSSAAPTLDRAWRLARREGLVWPEVGDVLMAVLTETGDVDRALEVGGRLLAELPASSARAGIHLAMARAAAAAARWSTAIGAIERARAAADLGDHAAHALADAIAADIAAGEHRYDQTESLASGALVVATREDDHELACEALLVIGRCARIRGVEEAETAFDRVIEIGYEHGLATWRLRGVMERASLDLWAFLPDAQIESAREEAAGAGALVVAAHLDNFLAWSALDHHDPDRADVAIVRCIALTRKMRLAALEGMAPGAAALAAAQRGDRSHMERRTAEAIAVSAGHADVAVMGPMARAAYWAP